eukprot:3246006-Rhodomonas_salina.1
MVVLGITYLDSELVKGRVIQVRLAVSAYARAMPCPVWIYRRGMRCPVLRERRRYGHVMRCPVRR